MKVWIAIVQDTPCWKGRIGDHSYIATGASENEAVRNLAAKVNEIMQQNKDDGDYDWFAEYPGGGGEWCETGVSVQCLEYGDIWDYCYDTVETK